MEGMSNILKKVGSAFDDIGKRIFGEPFTMEHALLTLFFVAGVYMYLGADEFQPEAAVFPQILAASMAILAALLLTRNHLPGPIHSFVAEPMQVLGDKDVADIDEATDNQEPADTADDASDDSPTGAYTYDIDDPRGPAVTGALCIVYMLLTFTIGMLYATPLFVAGYAWWAQMSPPKASALAILSFAIAYAFYAFISGDIAVGWYTDWRLPVP